MEGQTLPQTLLPQLKTISLDISNGQRVGLWSSKNLALLGIDGAEDGCTVSVEADSAIVHLGQLYARLEESKLLPRVQALEHTSWGLQGRPAHFGPSVEVRACISLLFFKVHVVFC